MFDKRIPVILALTLAVLPIGHTASAHHSFAAFDRARTVLLKGVIKQFEWRNPHVFAVIHGSVDGRGDTADWQLELTSPGNLGRMGWSRFR